MGRRIRKARRAMRPNRIAARFLSGGRHQTFGSIVTSPWKQHTVTSGKNRRKQYQAHRRRERQAALAERRRAAKESAAARKRLAAAKKAAPKPPRVRKPNPVIAVNPRTNKPITWAQAQRAVREAEERVERIAAGSPGDAPAKKPRPARSGKPAARRTPAAGKSPRRSGPSSSSKPRAARKKVGPPPDPTTAPGKDLRGLYYAVTCPCQGTGRIATFASDGRLVGSTSCRKHGRGARGSRKVFSRRAMTNAGLPGIAGWLGSRRGGNSDKQQRRAVRQAGRQRYAGPTEPCGGCRGEGIVNRDLTLNQREQYIARVQADRHAADRRPLGEHKLEAMARKAWPFDRCRQCKGLGHVPSQHAGSWYERTTLPQQHQPTAREAATGRRRPGR